MMEDIPKFTVTIITYNQEKLVGRALDSILIQKEWVYEIIVCDDCSTDKNWDVIMEYYNKHPNLIRPFRNDQNLGIYGNIERAWEECRGDLVINVSGDDTIKNGIFKKAYSFVKENNIDYKSKAVSIFCDFETRYPNGYVREGPRNNMLMNKNLNPVSLKLRGLISNRTSFSSLKLLKRYKPVPRDIGHFCDEMFDIQRVLYSDEIYYFRFVGSTYYAKIGVSANKKIEEYINSMDLTTARLKEMIAFSKKDDYFYKHLHHKRLFIYADHSMKQFYLATKYYLLSIEMKYGFRGLNIFRIVLDLRLFIKYLIRK
jgi:glycosyltransferase involved in cell wall biosynthesis